MLLNIFKTINNFIKINFLYVIFLNTYIKNITKELFLVLKNFLLLLNYFKILLFLKYKLYYFFYILKFLKKNPNFGVLKFFLLNIYVISHKLSYLNFVGKTLKFT